MDREFLPELLAENKSIADSPIKLINQRIVLLPLHKAKNKALEKW